MTFPHILAPAKIARRSTLLLASLLLVAAGCHDDGTGPAPTGTVAGTITSTLGGALSGVKITATPTSGAAPAEVTTDGDGKFSIAGVPVSDGKGTISLAGLPGNCTDPGDVAYSGLAKGQAVTKDIEVDCDPLTGTVAGTVTSSLGGPLADLTVSVDPDGDAPAVSGTTDADGKYSVAGVPLGSGSVAVSGVPDNCSVPAAATYDGLADDATKTVDVTVSCEATTGALTVTVTGVVNFDANVQVTGPNSYSTAITQTTTLTDLEPGSYTVSGMPVVVDDPVVVSRYVAATAGSPVSVAAGDTAAVAVTYAIRTGSGGLWFTNRGSKSISRFAAGQLHASGSPADTTSITTSIGALFAAFDSSGNLWVSNASDDELRAYTRDQLVDGGTPTPTRKLTSTDLAGPRGIAFDGNGNLWVVNAGNGNILQFSAAQVKNGGAATPAISITSTGLSNPTGAAFDAAGNLWIADFGGSVVAKYTVAQLTAGGSATPAVPLSATSGSLNHPTALAFDASGNLWVANDTPVGADNIIVSFAKADLASTGSPAPGVSIEMSGNPGPYGLAFDESGSLWAALNSANELVSYSAAQLASAGALTPSVVITAAAGGTMNGPSALVFDPHAAGLPIRW